MQALKLENAKLEKILAGQMLDGATLIERLVQLLKPRSGARAVDRSMRKKDYSQRLACVLAEIDPRVHRRKSTQPADDVLRMRLKKLSRERQQFDCRRLHILLKRGLFVGKRVHHFQQAIQLFADGHLFARWSKDYQLR